MEESPITLSTLPKTWILDIDGTIFKHNGYLIDGEDTILPGVENFFLSKVKKRDYVLFVTSREEKYRQITLEALKKNKIRFDDIIFSAPKGERIIVNDTKPRGMKTAYGIPIQRDLGLEEIKIEFNEKI